MGFCECGCGQETKMYRGMPRKFILGHHVRVKNPIPKGSKRPKEFGEKISQMKIELFTSERGDETRKLLAKARIGKPTTKGIKRPHLSGENCPSKRPEVREKMRQYYFDEEWRNKWEESRKRMRIRWKQSGKGCYSKGEKAPNWRGGISFDPYSPDFNGELKSLIKSRDKNQCRICHKTVNLAIHHIDYNKKNTNFDNLLTVCRMCNARLNFNRETYAKYIGNASKWEHRDLISAAMVIGTMLIQRNR